MIIPEKFIIRGSTDNIKKNFNNANRKELTPHMCTVLYKKSVEYLKLFPDWIMTEKFCLKVVKSLEIGLFYIPEQYVTKLVCEESVKFDCNNILYVPENFLSENLIIDALNNASPSMLEGVFWKISAERRTPKVLLKALNLHPQVINSAAFNVFKSKKLSEVKADLKKMIRIDNNKTKLKSKLEKL